MTTTESLQNGSVRKKGNQWYYRFRIRDADGTYTLREFKGGKSKKETQQLLKQALNDYKYGGEVFEPGNITVAQLCDEWWNSEIENSIMASNSRNGLKNAMKHIAKHPLGAVKLRNLTIEDIQRYIDFKTYGEFDENGNRTVKAYAESTLRKHFSVLNSMFKYAVYPKKYLCENPMQYVKKRKKEAAVNIFGEERKGKIQTITHEEYEKIVGFFRNDETLLHYALPVQKEPRKSNLPGKWNMGSITTSISCRLEKSKEGRIGKFSRRLIPTTAYWAVGSRKANSWRMLTPANLCSLCPLSAPSLMGNCSPHNL